MALSVSKKASAISKAKGTWIMLFRNDLRLHDNEALSKANQAALANNGSLLPVFVVDPRQVGPSAKTHYFGFPRTSVPRAKFLIECLEDIRESLAALGSGLLVRRGTLADATSSLIAQVENVRGIYMQRENCTEEVRDEKAIEQLCARHAIEFKTFWGSTVYHLDDLPFQGPSSLPNVFTQFRKLVESKGSIRDPLSAPALLAPLPASAPPADLAAPLEMGDFASSLPSPDNGSLLRGHTFLFRGGERAALERVNHYLWQKDKLREYKETRDGLVGMDYSSKLSVWLAFGAISPRYVVREIQKYEQQRVANDSTYWLFFELLWRDFFHFLPLKYGNRMFLQSGILSPGPTRSSGKLPAGSASASSAATEPRKVWGFETSKFARWTTGQTGVPFIDSNMRELLQTGFMSNRGRQNVASFLTKDLGLDWRAGAEWFESQLIDHDPGSNYGNWQYVSGVGTDPREDRHFNVIKQALQYDPAGDHVRLWCPELKEVPAARLQFPWRMGDAEQKQAKCIVGQDYPEPMLIHPSWASFLSSSANSVKPGWQAKPVTRPGSARGSRVQGGSQGESSGSSSASMQWPPRTGKR